MMDSTLMNPVEIGKHLRELRGNKTIKQVADDIGISTSALTMYEIGERIPRDEIKIKLCRYYIVDIGFFYEKK